MKFLRFSIALAVLLQPTLALAQGSPDNRGEIALPSPTYRGETASAPIPKEFHVHNEGGSDGAGLCVISSILCNGRYQGVPNLGVIDPSIPIGQGGKDSPLWRSAKAAPGGYSPDKLERLLDRVLPDEKWASYVGTDTDVLDRLSRAGYAIGATMNTGALYQYQPIHHMISLVHYRKGGMACVVDNNDPGKYHWMPASEFDRRWIDGGIGWAFIWTRKPEPNPLAIPPQVIALTVLLGLGLRRARLEFFSFDSDYHPEEWR
ncbi:hypothetical protein [Singulisphaera sp. PoT]|uniref:hypothetical protein n=1 Tax=Singulisphaera sp. PoT TaxID=3411797 RepID=UPI003BF4AFCF